MPEDLSSIFQVAGDSLCSCPTAAFSQGTLGNDSAGSVQPQAPDLVGETSKVDNGFQNVI